MQKPSDQAALSRYRNVLANFGRVTGYVQWKRVPVQWLADNLPEATVRYVNEKISEHAKAGGHIDQVEERRLEYVDWRFHYDLRLQILNRKIYVETVFDDADDLEECTIWIVSLHDQ